MANCNNCGATLSEGTAFCTHCGAQAGGGAQQQPAGGFQARPHYAPRDEQPRPDSIYAPVSMGAFVGYKLLMMIPIVNIVLLIVWAVSGEKINRRNWARAELVVMAIGVVISITLMILGASLFAVVADSIQYYW